MTEVSRKWIVENGEGHWELTYKGLTTSCDPGELREAAEELVKSAA